MQAWKSAVVVLGLATAPTLFLVSPGASEAQQPVAAGDPDAGAEIYATDCKGCHATSIGPTLRGVVGRPVASAGSFPGYSEGLRGKAGDVWTEANLDTFLLAPTEFAPGTMMTKAVPDAQARADLIAFLSTLPPPRQ